MFVVRRKIFFSVNSNFQVRTALSVQNLLGCHDSSNLLAVQLDGGIMKAPTLNPPAVSCTPSELEEGDLGTQKINVPHFLLDNRDSWIYPAQVIYASHNDLLVAIPKMWNFTSGEVFSLEKRLAE